MAGVPSTGGASAKSQGIRPSQSLYIQNLSVKEKKINLLRLLYTTFTSEAQVIDVTVLKSPKMQGQAHILFKDVQSATYAMEKLQGTMFLDRPLKISYSKNRSKTLDKMLGTTGEPEAPQSKAAPPNGLPAPPGGPPSQSNGLPRPPTGLPPPPAGSKPPTGLPAPPGRPPAAVTGPLNNLNLPPAPPVPAATAKQSSETSALKRKHAGSDDEAEEEEDEGSEMEMSDDDED